MLWETGRVGAEGMLWSGLTDNYVRVQAICAENLANTVTPARLLALTAGGLHGCIEL